MERRDKTKKLTFGAVMTAVGVLLLLLGSSMPGMRIACSAIAGVIIAIIVMRCGLLYALLGVIATVLLSFLVVPAKEIVLVYSVFFGPYALVKNLIERLHKLLLEWLIKLLYCGVVAVLLLRFSDKVLAMVPAVMAAHVWMYLPAVLILFAVYDIVFSKLIVYLFQRLHIG
ncbi:MAG: hypothetical protein LUE11_07175 [Clostridia bacterium]|nr:hypothetical protein [Clostridia bacterium]